MSELTALAVSEGYGACEDAEARTRFPASHERPAAIRGNPALTSIILYALRAWGGGSEFAFFEQKKKDIQTGCPFFVGAGYEARTRYLHLGKVALYQMS